MFKFLVKVVIVVLALQSGMDFLRKEEILIGEIRINYPLLREKLLKLIPTEKISEKISDFLNSKLNEALASDKFSSNDVYMSKRKRNFEPHDPTTPVVVHVVSRGETLSELSHIYGVPWQVIKKMNNISDERELSVGQHIRIPSRNRNFT